MRVKQSKILSHTRKDHHKHGKIILILADGDISDRRLELYLATNEVTNYSFIEKSTVEDEGVESVVYTYKYG